jgi:hypothetical protein
MWLSAFRNHSPARPPQAEAGRRRKPRRSRSAHSRPGLESLEDRCLLSFDPVVNHATGPNTQKEVLP